jgi:hypothetical protein
MQVASGKISNIKRNEAAASEGRATFDGVPLRIPSVSTISLEGSTRDTFRVIDGGPFPPLERHLRLNGPGLLILSFQEIEGRVIHTLRT